MNIKLATLIAASALALAACNSPTAEQKADEAAAQADAARAEVEKARADARATAAAAKARQSGGAIGRFVTASLTVDFAKPTPLGVELELRGKVADIQGRKVYVDLEMYAGETRTATGRVLMIELLEKPA